MKTVGKSDQTLRKQEQKLPKKGLAPKHKSESGMTWGRCKVEQEALFELDKDLAQPQYGKPLRINP